MGMEGLPTSPQPGEVLGGSGGGGHTGDSEQEPGRRGEPGPGKRVCSLPLLGLSIAPLRGAAVSIALPLLL